MFIVLKFTHVLGYLISELKAELSKKAKEKPPPPPKPKLIPVIEKPSHDVVAMEQLIIVLRYIVGYRFAKCVVVLSSTIKRTGELFYPLTLVITEVFMHVGYKFKTI